MQYRVLDLKYCTKRGAIDDEPLQRLVHGHEVVEISERFYTHDGLPHLLVGVRYRLAQVAPSPPRRDNGQLRAAATSPQTERPPTRNADWKEVLEEGNESLFEKLRSWRTARARADAVPPYVILTNVQLAEVANKKPATLSALKEVPGLGNGRAERFGKDLLEVISSGVVPRDMRPSQRGRKEGDS